MTIAVALLVAAGVLTAWVGTLAFLRLPTPLERLHAITFISVGAGLPLVAAAFVTDGVTSRSLKCLLVLLIALLTGPLFAHVTGRALYSRKGERR